MFTLSKGWQTVIGGFVVHLVLGTLYCWANITSAVTSFIRKHQSDVTYNDTLMIYAFQLVSQGATMLLGGLISQRIGVRKCCMLGGACILLATFCASLSTTLAGFICTQGIMFGVGIGICYSAPISASILWMPQRKGLATGIIVGGFGCGAFVFGLIATHVVNPHQQAVDKSGPNQNYFPPDSEVVNNVPLMYRVLGCCYFVFFLAACFLLHQPPSQPLDDHHDSKFPKIPSTGTIELKMGSNVSYQSAANVDLDQTNPLTEEVTIDFNSRKGKGDYATLDQTSHDDDMEDEKIGASSTSESNSSDVDFTVRELISTPLAWHVASCLITTTIGGMYIAGTFKTFGQLHFHNEIFLSTVSSFASVFNSGGRIFWGSMSDIFGPVQTLLVMSFLFSITIFTYPSSIYLGEAGFAMWTFLIFFFEGANFVLYFPIVVMLFGKKNSASNYGLIFSSYSLFVMINILVVSRMGLEFTKANFGMGLLTLFGFCNLIALVWHIRKAAKTQNPDLCKAK